MFDGCYFNIRFIKNISFIRPVAIPVNRNENALPAIALAPSLMCGENGRGSRYQGIASFGVFPR